MRKSRTAFTLVELLRPTLAPTTYAIITSRSFHTGVVNAARVDGSVSTVSDSIDLDVWRALATRAGGEVVQ